MVERQSPFLITTCARGIRNERAEEGLGQLFVKLDDMYYQVPEAVAIIALTVVEKCERQKGMLSLKSDKAGNLFLYSPCIYTVCEGSRLQAWTPKRVDPRFRSMDSDCEKGCRTGALFKELTGR